jgi:hypothetical protein
MFGDHGDAAIFLGDSVPCLGGVGHSFFLSLFEPLAERS